MSEREENEAIGQLLRTHRDAKMKLAAIRAKAAAWHAPAAKMAWLCHIVELGKPVPREEGQALASIDAAAVQQLLAEYSTLLDEIENQRQILIQAGADVRGI